MQLEQQAAAQRALQEQMAEEQRARDRAAAQVRGVLLVLCATTVA